MLSGEVPNRIWKSRILAEYSDAETEGQKAEAEAWLEQELGITFRTKTCLIAETVGCQKALRLFMQLQMVTQTSVELAHTPSVGLWGQKSTVTDLPSMTK